ncbi:hypothetical protein Ddc_18447 [Ditylenchus destructor]|nr:hypothetical protein Ddc_18447 [Ditylenchus destructor]
MSCCYSKMILPVALVLLVLCGKLHTADGKKIVYTSPTGFGNIKIDNLDEINARCFPQTRIMDGAEVTEIGAFTFVAVVIGEKEIDGETQESTCGGVFIHPDIIPTAKHCVTGMSTLMIDNIDHAKNDYICIPRFDEHVSDTVTVMGWGEYEGGDTSITLRSAELSTKLPPKLGLLNTDKCLYPFFCAVPLHTGRQTSIKNGDSGGPAVTGLVHIPHSHMPERLTLYGITIEHFTRQDVPVSVFLSLNRREFKRDMCTLTSVCLDV